MTALFCSSCANCGSEPFDGDPVKRYCGATPQVLAEHAEKCGNGFMAFWTAPREYTYTNSQMPERCKWFVPLEKIKEAA